VVRGHPELASGKGPYESNGSGNLDPRWNRHESLQFSSTSGGKFSGRDGQVFVTLFSHRGDELTAKIGRDPKIQSVMKAHGIKNNEALQADLSARAEAGDQALETVVGWDKGW